ISLVDAIILSFSFLMPIGSVHSQKVVHGDLHPSNVLVDGSGHPRLTDFGLATVAGDVESQLNTTTTGCSFNPQWRAPEVIRIGLEDGQIIRPNFKTDIYSFGSVMFFVRFVYFSATLS
ncbi:kinase-like domain-containing protein, partial [Suillus cothurnatus]